jgi:primary-amine oxidase
VLRDEKKVDDDTRYPHILLDEPPKVAVLAWKKGQELPRRALVIVKQGPRTFEAVVDIGKKKLDSWTEKKGVQPSFLIEEILGVASIVKKSPEWVAAMKKRGFESFDGIFCGPLAAGYYGAKEEESRRLVRTLCFDASVTKNFWGRPIENLVALVDLNTKEVVKVFDEGVVPVPQTPVEYDDKAVTELRKPKPLLVTQPDGPGFELDGSEVSWERWKFHVRSDPRAGLVLSLVRYVDEGKPRSVLYQGALSEIFVPYSDPSIGWYFRTYLDAGEYGVGRLAVPLVPGADCPANAVYLGDVLADDAGKPKAREKIVCIFERQAGDVSWRHYDLVGETTESRRARDLVVRQIAAIGNYDYVFDWTLREDGTIRVSVGATGIAEVKGVKPRSAADPGGAEAAAYGRYVDEHLVATNHDHFLNFRIDLDVDGPANSFVADQIVAKPVGKGPRKSIWVTEPKTLKREQEGRLHMSMEKPALWRVTNPAVTGRAGYPVSYELEPGHNAMNLLSADDYPSKRAGFAAHTLWVTRYSPSERWAGGDYPNQSRGGDGLPAWTKANRSIENADIVLWYTLGFHHVVRNEDWPTMPVSVHEFSLRPFGFFPSNPALDLPKE